MSHTLKNGIFSLFVLCSIVAQPVLIAESEIINPDGSVAIVSPETAAELNIHYATWNASLDDLQSSLQHLSQLVATEKVTPANRYEAFDWLQNLSMVIGEVRQFHYNPMTPKKLVHFFKISKTIAQAINIAIDNNLNVRPDIAQLREAVEQLNESANTSLGSNLPLQAAASYARETEVLIHKLGKKISRCGVTWYNRAYGRLSFINRQLGISQTISSLAVLALVGAVVLRITPKNKCWVEESTEANVADKATNWVGNIKLMVGDSNTKDEYWSNVLDQFAKFGTGVAGIDWVNNKLDLSGKFSRTTKRVDAFLRGTSTQGIDKLRFVDNITLDDPMFDCVRDLFDPFNKILQFLEDPETFIHSGMQIEKCLLLTGTPGSGKTLCAEALSGSINKLFMELGRFEKCGFINVAPWDDFEKIVEQAEQNAPCVIFIDEFHLYQSGQQINSNAMAVSEMLQKIDEISKGNDPQQQIFVVAATNRPDLLAKALLRDGRFGKSTRIEFPVPSFAQRRMVFEALCKKSAVDTTNIDLDNLAQLTHGAAFSTLNKIFENAGFLAKKQATGINYDHLYQALNKVMRGLTPKIELSDEDLERVATHMAGIALAHLLLDTPVELESVTLYAPARTIVEQNQFVVTMENKNTDVQHEAEYGDFFTKSTSTYNIQSIANPHINCKLLLAGVEAEKALLGSTSNYRKSSGQTAYDTAKNSILDGIAWESLPKAEQNRIGAQAFEVTLQARKELQEFFEQNKEKLRAVSQLLQDKKFITAEQILEVINS